LLRSPLPVTGRSGAFWIEPEGIGGKKQKISILQGNAGLKIVPCPGKLSGRHKKLPILSA
jgi:hypothetical protein